MLFTVRHTMDLFQFLFTIVAKNYNNILCVWLCTLMVVVSQIPVSMRRVPRNAILTTSSSSSTLYWLLVLWCVLLYCVVTSEWCITSLSRCCCVTLWTVQKHNFDWKCIIVQIQCILMCFVFCWATLRALRGPLFLSPDLLYDLVVMSSR